ncbi:MAG: fatty acid desaturase family protein [Sphingomonas sp.]
MMTSTTFDGPEADTLAAAPVAERARARVADDMAMLRAAVEQTRDLQKANPAIYWIDFVVSVAVGYAALFAAMMPALGGWAVLAGAIAVLALYRGSSFIHELTHVKPSSVPGFHLGWNLLMGIPLLVPSFMYEGVHTLHHARTRYGTAEDPEYLPLALMKPWSLPVFVGAAMLAPVALLFRFAVLSPLSLVFPAVRTRVIACYSALSINPGFRRRPPEGQLKRDWQWQAAGASLWALSLIALVATGVVPLRAFLIFLGVASGLAVINQVRTLVAHLWENEGEPMSVTAQYLDSVNVPPPGMLPFIWAPVGLRYHALHHLLPSVPYHHLGEAHRRLSSVLGAQSLYQQANYRGLTGLVYRLAASTMGVRPAR